jgi:hypothetical protein
LKKENRLKCLEEGQTALRGGPPKKRHGKKMLRALRLADYHCEMCGAEDSQFFPLSAYHLDGADQSWDPDLTVILCPSDMLMSARCWPPGSGWRNGTPQWAFRRDIFRAVVLFSQTRGPRKTRGRKSITGKKSRAATRGKAQAARVRQAGNQLLAGETISPDKAPRKEGS